jgi:hypothetical protein
VRVEHDDLAVVGAVQQRPATTCPDLSDHSSTDCQLRAEHVYHLDLVVVALRLAYPWPRAVWRCTIDGPLCRGLAGGAREGGAAAGGASAPPREPFVKSWGLSPRVDLGHENDLVAVDFIGGDSAEGSIPCLEDDDRDHEGGGEGSTHVVEAKACASLRDICLGSCWEAGDHPPRDRTPQARRLADITGCVRLARIHAAARACP